MKYLVTFMFVLSGCATVVGLDEGGSKVRAVSSTPHNCKYLGKKETAISNFWVASSNDTLLNALKNKVFAEGANTVEVTGYGENYMIGEAYFCNYN